MSKPVLPPETAEDLARRFPVAEREVVDKSLADLLETPAGLQRQTSRGVDPEIVAANKRALGKVAEDPEVKDTLEELAVPIKCARTLVGKAAGRGDCSDAELVVETLDDFVVGKQLSREVEELGEPPIRVRKSSKIEEFFNNPQLISEVEGYGTVSYLYDRVSRNNIDEIFQFNLEEKFGPNIFGGKAVAYINDDGSVSIAFMTESERTHHRHALGTIIGGEKGRLVYNGEYDNYLISDLTSRAFGFEFQYDTLSGKIIGMQESSQITNLQKNRGVGGWTLQRSVVENIEKKLLEKIDPELFDDSLFVKPINEWIDKSELPLAS